MASPPPLRPLTPSSARLGHKNGGGNWVGGGERNRTAVQGFAGPCLNHSATPPGALSRSTSRIPAVFPPPSFGRAHHPALVLDHHVTVRPGPPGRV